MSRPIDPANRPSLEQIRAEMGIPSEGTRRGQRDAVGFASTRAQMDAVWRAATALSGAASLALPSDSTGDSTRDPASATSGDDPVPGAICPHDDYLYAGGMYPWVLSRIQAKTVIIVGVFHPYRRFGMRDRLVFDPYESWRTPDGHLRVSSVRDAWIDALPGDAWVQDAAMHDAEHSVEAIAYWLKRMRPDREILPLLVPAARFDRLRHLAEVAGSALVDALRERELDWGRDLAVVISSDAVHYGADFAYTPHGAGDARAYAQAVERDRALMRNQLSGPIESRRIRSLYETWVDPENPGTYRLTWCGRFSIPFGLMLLEASAKRSGLGPLVGTPVAYGTSLGPSRLPDGTGGLGVTAPATLEHFVGYPGVWIQLPP